MPRNTKKGLLNGHDIFQMAYVSILMALVSLIAYEWLITQGADVPTASTMMVNIIVFSKIFYFFSIRTSHPAFSSVFFSNKKAFWIIGLMIFLQLILTYVPFMQVLFSTEPLNLIEWGLSIAAGIIVLLIAELDKGIRYIIKKETRDNQSF